MMGEHGQVVMNKSDFFDRLTGAIRPQRNFFNVGPTASAITSAGSRPFLKADLWQGRFILARRIGL